ncbi:MAG: response regulator transcription factor [Anaerolineae bacterium]|nr:response regulator transcription factor [Anaerolineae bacterium]
MIRVLICDDQDMVTEGLRVILGTAPEIEVAGVAHDGAEAVEKAATLRPDVILMDLKMPGVNGIQATRQICDHDPDARVLVLTTYDADEWVFDAIRSGACGYLLKDTPRRELIAAIHGTFEGKTHVDPTVAGKLFAHVTQTVTSPADTAMIQDLSERELDVLRLLARGMSNGDIARHLFLSEGTVRNYVSAVLAKLHVADRTQAAVLALRYGLAEK